MLTEKKGLPSACKNSFCNYTLLVGFTIKMNLTRFGPSHLNYLLSVMSITLQSRYTSIATSETRLAHHCSKPILSYAVTATHRAINPAQDILDTQLPRPYTAEAGSAIDAQFFPQAGRTPLHSPEQKFQNLHVAQASPSCSSGRGMQKTVPPKSRKYVTDWPPKVSMCACSRRPSLPHPG